MMTVDHYKSLRAFVSTLFLLLVINAGWSAVSLAQVATPKPEPICRKLAPGDKYYPEFTSCCDLDGGRSRWVSANGKTTDYTSICSLWGIKPKPELNIAPPQASQQQSTMSGQVPTGKYSCTLVSPVGVTISSNGKYQLDDGSSGQLVMSERSQDGIGPYIKYKMTGGSFDGFFFLQRSNGQLLLGRVGWTRCEKR